MASSSTSISKYDIFLSFCGVDTRHKFTDHLNKALKKEHFRTFRDDDDIPKGKRIKSQLREAIIQSRMSVVVLSENYFNSKACLFELQTILKQCKDSDHLIYPVFYELVPGKIEEQAKKLREQAKKLRFESRKEKLRVKKLHGRSVALKAVAKTAGIVSGNEYETKFIEEIVVQLKRMLAGKYPRNGDYLKHEENGRVLAGRLLQPLPDDFVENTEAGNTKRVWECLSDDKVPKIGVYGMGGIGKTTIMKHINNLLVRDESNFRPVYWVTVSTPFNIKRLQRDLAMAMDISLSDGEDERATSRRASELLTELSQRVSLGKRYVLILDDLWEKFDLGTVGILEPTITNGCKLVVTTRLFEVCQMMACTPIKVELLTEQEALTLFLHKAIGRDMELDPKVKKIAAKMAQKCARLPHAIFTEAEKMMGLQEIQYWRNGLNELINPMNNVRDGDSEVFKRLKFSYDHLEDKVLQYSFLYCALYPKDLDIPMKGLTEYLIEKGLIADLDSLQAKTDKGLDLLHKLYNTSLLERFTNQSGEVCVHIHDLIRNMALRIAKSGELVESVPYKH